LGIGVLGAVPAGAQTTVPTQLDTLTVTKTVVGRPPAGTTFVLHINCIGQAVQMQPGKQQGLHGQGGAIPVFDEDITFGASGGSKDYVFNNPAQCVVTETNDGGADSSTGPVTVDIAEPTHYSAVITNTFDPAATTTTAPAPAAAAAAVQATPAFTG
jgi:hypothetical protein